MPRLNALKPFTPEVGGDDSAHKDSAIEEGEEDFITRPATEQIKRRLSGVEHPGESLKTPAWQSLQVCISTRLPPIGLTNRMLLAHVSRYRGKSRR